MNANVDPRIDKMVAYLYGELPESEERAFRRLLEKDDALRAEYEELAGTRETLQGWEVEERVPSFVMVENTAPAARAPRRAAAGDGWWARFRESLRGFAITPAWGLAATAALLLVLAAGGFRVEKVDGGVAFRFGARAQPAPVQVATPAQTQRPSALPPRGAEFEAIPVSDSDYATSVTAPGGTVVPAGAYLTREDLESYDSNLMLTLAQLLNEYSRKRDREVTEGFQSLYQQVNSQRTYDYEQLAGRIDLLGRELLLETDRSARGFEEVLKSQPINGTPLSDGKED